MTATETNSATAFRPTRRVDDDAPSSLTPHPRAQLYALS
jgi:hypothetical protein